MVRSLRLRLQRDYHGYNSTQPKIARSYVARAQSCVSQNVTMLRLLNFGKEPARKADD